MMMVVVMMRSTHVRHHLALFPLLPLPLCRLSLYCSVSTDSHVDDLFNKLFVGHKLGLFATTKLLGGGGAGAVFAIARCFGFIVFCPVCWSQASDAGHGSLGRLHLTLLLGVGLTHDLLKCNFKRCSL